MREYSELKRMEEEIKGELDRVKAELIEYMQLEDIDTLQGVEHKATYKAITSSRLDSKALKLDHPEIIDKYSKATTSMRFNFA